MVVDHVFQIEAVELGTGSGFQLGHFLGTDHARHEHKAIGVMSVGIRHVQITVFQPALHHFNFVVLRQVDARGHGQHTFVVGARFCQL